MSQHVRFAALAGTLFVLSYTSVTWVMAGAPMLSMRLSQLSQPDARVAALPVSAPSSTSVPSSTRVITLPPPFVPSTQSRPIQPSALPPGDGNSQRDRLRLAALQASTAYALTPCDEIAKAAMIEAVSSYAKAWHDMMGCGPNGCDYKKINATAAAFSTPLDIQVRDAVGAAFGQRGISIDDFPSPLRINVAMLVRGRGAPAIACTETRAQIVR